MKRKFIAIFFTLIFFTSSALRVLASPPPQVVLGGKWYSPSLGEFYTKVFTSPDQEIFGERYTFAQVVWIINSISLLFNIDLTSKENVDKIQQFFAYFKEGNMPPLAEYQHLGISGFVVGLMSEIYTHPAGSGIQYLANGLQKFSVVSPAYAQGYGYSNNTIVLPLWTASRNICYFLMVILLIAAGFMIMFRIKVNAQTAVSIQIMIPKIIVTLVLITFSYAIAGLVIDLVYLLLTLTLSALFSTGVIIDLGQAVKFFTGTYWNIVGYYLLGLLVQITGATILATFLTVPGIGVIIGLILSIAILWLLLKIWWMLMKTYLSIMISFVLAPWQILLGLVPGSKGGFGPWLRNLIANASVFVITPLMFLLSVYLFNPLTWAVSEMFGITWLADLVQGRLTGVHTVDTTGKAVVLPLFGSGGGLSGTFAFFASLAILALIPKTAQMIKDSLKVGGFKYGSAFGEALSPVRWAAKEGQAGGVEKAKIYAETNPTDPTAQAAYRGAQTRQSLIDRGMGGKG